jgi:hypothetical protein
MRELLHDDDLVSKVYKWEAYQLKCPLCNDSLFGSPYSYCQRCRNLMRRIVPFGHELPFPTLYLLHSEWCGRRINEPHQRTNSDQR